MLIVQKKTLSFNGDDVVLTKHEYRMFEFLLINVKRGDADYNTMISYVWGARKCVVSLNTVSQLAYRVRAKLKSIGIPVTIKISQHEGPGLIAEKRLVVIKKGNGIFDWRFYFLS